MSAKTKLKEIQKIVKFPTEEDREQMKAWQQKLKNIELHKSFLDHPVTRNIVADITGAIQDINRELLVDEAMEIDDRRAKIIRRNVWQDFLNLFHPELTSDKMVEQEIGAGIKQFKTYYGEDQI